MTVLAVLGGWALVSVVVALAFGRGPGRAAARADAAAQQHERGRGELGHVARTSLEHLDALPPRSATTQPLVPAPRARTT